MLMQLQYFMRKGKALATKFEVNMQYISKVFKLGLCLYNMD